MSPLRAPQKISLKPKKHHGFFFLIWFCGFLLPPLAVAVRFGIGTDFFINVVLTICGYIPGHAHNFYIQNIRNNYNKKRTPKWARKLGLIDESEFERKKKKSQWAGRYSERVPESTLVGAELAEGEEGANYNPEPVVDPEEAARRKKAGLWTRREEEYYNEDGEADNQRHWHYPANFEGAAVETPPNESSDRWDRTRAARDPPPANSSSSKPKSMRKPSSKADKRAQILAYAPKGNNNPTSRGDYQSSHTDNDPLGADDGDVPEWGRDYGAPKGRAKGRRERSTTQNSAGSWGDRNDHASPNGGYSAGAGAGYNEGTTGNAPGGRSGEENWDHQF